MIEYDYLSILDIPFSTSVNHNSHPFMNNFFTIEQNDSRMLYYYNQQTPTAK